MKSRTKRIFKGIGLTLVAYVLSVLLLFHFNILWSSPPYYYPENYTDLEIPIMSMQDYDEIINSHRRPYYFSVNSSSGAAHIIGVNHTNNPSHPHLDSIITKWGFAQPSVALVESRLGFLFTWTQDPIKKYGERGLTAKLAKSDGIPLYTWEPDRENEINFLLEKYSGKDLALFYVLRPYFSYSITYRENNGDALFNRLIAERTDYSGLRNQLRSSQEVINTLEKDYPTFDWATHISSKGWPEGYLMDIWNDSNLFRDRHMIQLIIELVEQGETVFVTMGASHAPRIEKTLIYELLN
ncbi:MAG: hypothetical protein JJ971_01515 [Balneolaceae bacterium]|nr:hypothetical protein [Balneolaceae bacterium]MBO6545050.1 hypothetical protein [Balneolaceae bacterium]MBO6646446.1 hypothetical protein [Balneolaceae bacterium]